MFHSPKASESKTIGHWPVGTTRATGAVGQVNAKGYRGFGFDHKPTQDSKEQMKSIKNKKLLTLKPNLIIYKWSNRLKGIVRSDLINRTTLGYTLPTVNTINIKHMNGQDKTLTLTKQGGSNTE